MGALTVNRKRGDEYLSLNHLQSPYQNSHISKRPRFSFMQHTPNQDFVSSNYTVSRVSRYPEAKPPLKRQVHAPYRILKFGFCDKLKQDSCTSRYCKNKDVIEVDNEHDDKNEIVSNDSSFEGVEVIENEKYEVPIKEISGKDVEQRHHNNFQPSSSSVVSTDLNNGGVDGDILRMESAEKILDSLSLYQGVIGLQDVQVYKKLLESAQRRGSKLKSIGFEIELYEKRRDSLRQLQPVKQPEEKLVEELPCEPFVPLTEKEEAEVDGAFASNRRSKVLVSDSGTDIDITGHILQCLRPGAWLNDEVINVYLGLLKDRERRDPQKFLKCHFFNTFFYKKLVSGNKGYDFKAVKRWTSIKKLGYTLLECDKIFVPIHQEIHWCLAVINKKDKKFQYLDSLRGKDMKVLNALARYYVDEVKDKCGKDIDVSAWEQEFVEELPEQENGFDCGMFMLKYVDFYSRGLGLCFGQSHMPYFRVRTAKEILRLRAE
ncbi:ubiquitin-like-specific protease ESD4 isoform X3 [Mangifera indica]|uniref:ubiquitin-like-specific protease ESD4 isoform X3 n=1 Tax=Mangifera indica TaxID=29780 RepID=UPI001CFA8058|nr:ubiquitin-like-specific protease ESD4 isoform X3 [Mangifera indica]